MLIEQCQCLQGLMPNPTKDKEFAGETNRSNVK